MGLALSQLMQFCHFCGMHSFVSGPLFQFAVVYACFTAGIQNCPAGSAPVPTAALPAPATATSPGAARPSSPQMHAEASFKLAVAAAVSADACFAADVPGPGGSASDLAAGASSGRLQAVCGGGCGGGRSWPSRERSPPSRECLAAVPRHVPRARLRRCCGRLRRGRPHRRRPPLPRPAAPARLSARRCGRLLRRGRPPAAATSHALVGVAVVDVFFAAAVVAAAGGARRGHVCVCIAGTQESTARKL